MNSRCYSTALALLVCLTLCSCGVAVREATNGYHSIRYSSWFEVGRRGILNPAEMEWAKIAWKYFQNNTEAGNAVAGGLEKQPLASAWNIGDYLAALNAARELGIIKEAEFTDRAVRVIQFLNSMELFDRRLPNLYYNVQSGAMSNAANLPGQVGWSAQDLGRLLIWLRITSQALPSLSEYIDKAVLRWNYCDILDGNGTLYAGRLNAGKTDIVQEGRLGYEEYAALGFQAWGFDTRQASRLEPFAKAHIEGVEVLYDSRDPRDSRQDKVFAPVVTLPHALMGIEFNWEAITSHSKRDTDRPLARLAQAVYDAQEARYRRQHILTARTDHPLGRAPNFVYDTIFLAGYPWNTVTVNGTFAPHEALVSTRAAFGMWALWKTDYINTLMSSTRMLNDPARGWFEGRFEKTGGPERTISSTTNAMVLEALLYVKTGKLYRPNPATAAYYSSTLRSEFSGPQTCLPQTR
jgi:hypothetical protein